MEDDLVRVTVSVVLYVRLTGDEAAYDKVIVDAEPASADTLVDVLSILTEAVVLSIWTVVSVPEIVTSFGVPVITTSLEVPDTVIVVVRSSKVTSVVCQE